MTSAAHHGCRRQPAAPLRTPCVNMRHEWKDGPRKSRLRHGDPLQLALAPNIGPLIGHLVEIGRSLARQPEVSPRGQALVEFVASTRDSSQQVPLADQAGYRDVQCRNH